MFSMNVGMMADLPASVASAFDTVLLYGRLTCRHCGRSSRAMPALRPAGAVEGVPGAAPAHTLDVDEAAGECAGKACIPAQSNSDR